MGSGGVSGAAAAGSLAAGSVSADVVVGDESGEEVDASLAAEASALGDDVLAPEGAPESGAAGGLPAGGFGAEGEFAGAAVEAESSEGCCGVCVLVVEDAAAGALVLGVGGGAAEVAFVASGA